MKQNLQQRSSTGEKFLFNLIVILSLASLLVLQGFLLLAGTPETRPQHVNTDFQQGQERAKAKDYHSAILLFSRAIRQDGQQAIEPARRVGRQARHAGESRKKNGASKSPQALPHPRSICADRGASASVLD